jgi:hypothetical protein
MATENSSITASDSDILRIFEEMNEKAKEINPEISEQMKAYNDNRVSLASYQQFIFDQNTIVDATSSNHVVPN